LKVIPRSTNAAYHGSSFAGRVRLVLGGLKLVSGSIHLFASDGAASDAR
jgi:hypothetical protein